MPDSPISAEDAAELNKLFDALPDAIQRASKALEELGVTDECYLMADADVEQILARIDELMNR